MSDQHVTDHLWWSDKLEVAVHDAQMGRTFRVQFTQAIDGLLKHSGGGGYRRNEQERFNEAVDLAADWVTNELGYRIENEGNWSRVKALRGMDIQDQLELRKLTDKERAELGRRIRRGQLDFLGGDT
jgi:hypothetical protein